MLLHLNNQRHGIQPNMFMLIKRNNAIFKSMHVHVNTRLTLLTSLYHITYALMHVHIHMHVHCKQTNQNPTSIKERKKQTKQSMEVETYKHGYQLRTETYYINKTRKQPNCMHMHTLSMCTHAVNMQTHTRPKP